MNDHNAMTDEGTTMSANERRIGTVLSTVPFTEAEINQLRVAFEPSEFVWCPSDDVQTIADTLPRADVAVLEGDLDQRFIDAPHLGWVHCDHSGLNKSAKPEVFERGLIVTGSAGRSAPALAQHGFYFALALTFEAPQLLDDQRNHVWRGIDGYFYKPGLWGKTLGVVGFGHTGKEMAALGRAFGMRVVVYRRSAEDVPETVDVLLASERGDSIDTLIEQSDVIMLATQLTDKTHHMFSHEQFARMKRSAFIINLARGAVIDEQALISALRSGEIAGAGLDVFETEPLPVDSELWDIPNLILTPHMTPRMPDKTQRSINTIIENIRRYKSGEPMLNAITPDDLYTQAVTAAPSA